MSSTTITPNLPASADPALVTTGDAQPANRHALTPMEKQRAQLAKLLKEPSKPVFIPPPPKEKTVRPPREMMKNVQGSSAGAGSGEFHVYKANRRREYERLKLMEEQKAKVWFAIFLALHALLKFLPIKEQETAEYERRRKEREELTGAKAAKNRAKRMKKKERAKIKGKEAEQRPSEANANPGDDGSAPFKKRRLVNGAEIKFQQPGEYDDDRDGGGGGDGSDRRDDEDRSDVSDNNEDVGPPHPSEVESVIPIPVVEQKIVIHDSD